MLTHWSYCSLALSHRDICKDIPRIQVISDPFIHFSVEDKFYFEKLHESSSYLTGVKWSHVKNESDIWQPTTVLVFLNMKNDGMVEIMGYIITPTLSANTAYIVAIYLDPILGMHWVLYRTRTIRTPAFWKTPCRLMITHTSDSHQIPSQTRQSYKF